jgi:hypothetical protein
MYSLIISSTYGNGNAKYKYKNKVLISLTCATLNPHRERIHQVDTFSH